MFSSTINDIESKVKNPHDVGIIDTKTQRQMPSKTKLRFFSTCSTKLLIEGIDVDLDMSYTPQNCKTVLMDELQKYIRNIKSFDLIVYTAGGLPFLSGTLGDLYSSRSFGKIKPYIYGVLFRPFRNSTDLNTVEYKLCNIKDDFHKQLLSPIYKSTTEGLCDIACLLGYLNNFGSKGDKLLKSVAATIKFPPLITSLNRIIDRNNVTYRDIITVCSTFQMYFSYLLKESTPPNKILEYGLRCCNMITHIKNLPENLPIQSLDLKSNTKNPRYQPLIKLNQPSTVYLWKADFNEEFEYVNLEPIQDLRAIEDANKSFASFTPIAPLSIRSVNKCSIIKGKNHSFLYLQQSAIKGNSDNIDIIDPTEGVAKSVDLDQFAAEQGNSKYDKVANLIDPDKVEQIVLVCFDRSSSMFSSLDGDFKRPPEVCSRCTIAMQYLVNFANKTYAFRIPCILGLLTFCDDIDYRCPLSPLIPDFEEKGLKNIEPNGMTVLWDSIIFACDQLNEFTKDGSYIKAKKRILVISDGEDTQSNSTSLEATLKLIKNDIILDSINISSTGCCKELAVVSHISGGVAINPQDINKGLEIIESDSFLSIKDRKENLNPIIPGNRSTKRKNLMKNRSINEQLIKEAINYVNFDETIELKIARDAVNNTRFATPECVCSNHKTYSHGNTPRERRILRELHYAALIMNDKLDSYDPDLMIYPFFTDYARWAVFLKAPEFTPYKRKWFFILTTFPEEYPIEPPSFRFIYVPYNLNISSEGRICLEILEKGYIPSFHVADIIQQIKQVFLIQSPDWAINIDILETFIHDRKTYLKKANESAKIHGRDNFKDFFLTNTIISSDVKDDFSLTFDNELTVPSYMLSQISGRVLKDPVKVPSVGQIYDRDELKQLIATNKNPICIMSGLPITETLQQVDSLDSLI